MVRNEGRFVSFAQNWLPWQRLLWNRKNGRPDRQHSLKYHSVKIVKIGPVDP